MPNLRIVVIGDANVDMVIRLPDRYAQTPGNVHFNPQLHGGGSAAKHIPVSQLGTTDDCGFSPFADDTGVSREIAFAKIKARVEGTKLAEKEWGLLTNTDVKRLERPSGSPFLEKPLN